MEEYERYLEKLEKGQFKRLWME